MPAVMSKWFLHIDLRLKASELQFIILTERKFPSSSLVLLKLPYNFIFKS